MSQVEALGSDTSVVAAVSVAFGAGATALGRMLAGNRRTDKVDAVAAIAAAYDRVAERSGKQLDDVIVRLNRAEERCEYLERELRKRDELIVQYLGDPASRATAAEVAADKITHAAATAAASVLSTAAHAALHPDPVRGRRAADAQAGTTDADGE